VACRRPLGHRGRTAGGDGLSLHGRDVRSEGLHPDATAQHLNLAPLGRDGQDHHHGEVPVRRHDESDDDEGGVAVSVGFEPGCDRQRDVGRQDPDGGAYDRRPHDRPPTTAAPTTTAPKTKIPVGAPETGGGGTAGLQDGLLFVIGGGAVFAGLGSLAYRRRLARRPAGRPSDDRETADR